MLSRTADHLYWMSRFTERAENLARLLDVTHQMSLVPQSVAAENQNWGAILALNSLEARFAETYDEVNAENDHDHAHALVFDTWSYSQATPLRMAQLQTVINSLPTSIYRVKGFLYLADQPASKIVLQMVGRRIAVSDGGAWVDEPQTRLVFISQHETVNYSAIEIALNRCRIESNV